MISSDVIRGYNDPIILSILTEGDSYGYEISKKIRERSNEKYIIKETTLYSAFTRLQKNGLISSYPGNETFGKKRTYYKITELGYQFLEKKQIEWEITKEVVNLFLGGK
ncbi:PadR family transcriptional regulator [Vagococcus penaei]|uniref:PadR family transcriptional regulator n=1 Tax=Vagococcus penaei TaxID=633807 RepID=A0A1Q2D8T1_9ENTE|nr:PadR family transcriptional regulator [Vagococcus penaei]AQP54804.1 PadR family transcriptional regulator [Vagococcus penaei]RSU02172.1 PadR family transcriptional regulator [Vagococcus penaei]